MQARRRVFMVQDEDDDFGLNTTNHSPIAPDVTSESQEYGRHQNFFRPEQQNQQAQDYQNQEDDDDDAYHHRVRPTMVPLNFGADPSSAVKRSNSRQPNATPTTASTSKVALVVEVQGQVLVDTYGIDLSVIRNVQDLEATYLGLKQVVDKLHGKLEGYLPQKYGPQPQVAPETPSVSNPLVDAVVNTSTTRSGAKSGRGKNTPPVTHSNSSTSGRKRTKTTTPVVEEAPLPVYTSDEIPESQEDLMELDGRTLKAMCKSIGVPFTGTRRQLMERLAAFKVANPTRPANERGPAGSQSLDDFICDDEEEDDAAPQPQHRNSHRNSNLLQRHSSSTVNQFHHDPHGEEDDREPQPHGHGHHHGHSQQQSENRQRGSKVIRFSSTAVDSNSMCGEKMEPSRSRSMQSSVIPSGSVSTAGSRQQSFGASASAAVSHNHSAYEDDEDVNFLVGGGDDTEQRQQQYSTPVDARPPPSSRKSYVCPSTGNMLLSDSDDDEPNQRPIQQQNPHQSQKNRPSSHRASGSQQQPRSSSVFIPSGGDEFEDEGSVATSSMRGSHSRQSGRPSDSVNSNYHRYSSQAPRGSPAIEDEGDAYLAQDDQVRELTSQGRASNGQRLSAASGNSAGGVSGFFRKAVSYIPGMASPRK